MRLPRALLVPVLLALCGCATWQQTTRRPGLVLAEASWQVLHAVDFAQTVTIARQPARFEEEGIPTVWLIGEHPSEDAVEACWAGFALLHVAGTRFLAQRADRGRAWRWALYGWEALSIADGAYAVTRNASIGLRPFGPRER